MTDRLNPSIPIIERPELVQHLSPLIRDTARCFSMGHTRIILNHEPDGWHLSISCRDRDPTWGEIVTARYRLLPFVPYVAIILPPMDEYVNLHPYTFHLHELTHQLQG